MFDRAWRVIATALSFGVYGLGSLLLWYGVYPLTFWRVLPARRGAYARRLSHRAFRFLTGFMAWVGMWRYEVEKADRLQQSGRIVVANHPSFLDILLLFSRLENAVCIVKPSLAAVPLVGRPIRCCRHLPAEDSRVLVSEAVRALHEGACLILFPQGTRTLPGREIRFQRSVARIALEAGVPMVPVYFDYRPLLFGKHQRWYHVPAVKPRVRMTVGEEIQPAEIIGEELPLSIASRRLSRWLERYFTAWERRHGFVGNRDQTVDHPNL
ncbi:lysophospholipid acyltransferase family protein [Methylohalobius crimeensis]|uniref:lysophospholipid acyltransferase family protein n=1 Tax=Methylohalobius crimeensis TaxID=244365 RepID=UPI00040A07D2|nr:lysophospholipid acyltransferase family protein [Methylohalobius crimeensis]